MVADVRHAGPAAEARPEVFVPMLQSPTRFATLALALHGGEPAVAASAAAARSAVARLDRDLAVARLQPMSALLARSLAGPRFQALIAALLAAVAIVSAGVGLYGLTAHGVGRRSREIGIRAALGASRRRLFAQVLARALAVALAGIALGLAAAAATARLLAALLHGVEVYDPLVFTAVPLLLLLLAAVAAALPAHRAARADPQVALRAE